MQVSKRFRWEGAHRLPWHTGGCENLHGHSYEMWVTVDGPQDARGMVIDFKDIKRVLKPLVEAWDHATLVDVADTPLHEAMQTLGSKHYVLPYDTTSENLCVYVQAYLRTHAGSLLRELGVTQVSVRIQETETCFAELTQRVDERTGEANGHAVPQVGEWTI